MNQKSDTELIEKIKQKDSRALEELYDRYERPIYSFAFKILKDQMLAEEVVQELFFRIWHASDKYEENKGKVISWMFTLTRNIAIDLVRKHNRRKAESLTESEQMEQIAEENSDISTQVTDNIIGEKVREVLNELNSEQKQIIEKIYFQGYTQQEVSDAFAIPLGTVKGRVRLAMKQLKQKMSRVIRREEYHE